MYMYICIWSVRRGERANAEFTIVNVDEEQPVYITIIGAYYDTLVLFFQILRRSLIFQNKMLGK